VRILVQEFDHCRSKASDHVGQTEESRQVGIGFSLKYIIPIRLLSLLLFIAAFATERPPNIVLIMADDMGYETLGVNGELSYDTPHLDLLAQHGMRFTHVFSTPFCTPTRVQLMTGKYNFRNYIGFGLLDPTEQTFAHLLQDVGYATGIAASGSCMVTRTNENWRGAEAQLPRKRDSKNLHFGSTLSAAAVTSHLQYIILELDRNTLVLFTTDNGTHRTTSSQHKTGLIQGRKAYPVAAGTHVPLIAYRLGTIQPNIVNDGLVDFTDFLPTLIEAAGSTVPDDFTADGLSFYGQLTGRTDIPCAVKYICALPHMVVIAADDSHNLSWLS